MIYRLRIIHEHRAKFEGEVFAEDWPTHESVVQLAGAIRDSIKHHSGAVATLEAPDGVVTIIGRSEV